MRFNSENRPRIEDCVMDFAMSIAKRSTCKRMQVGAAVLSPDKIRILGYGYNGQPRGLPNDGCTKEAGKCGCVHAEWNALLKAGWLDGGILVCTHMPCDTCSRVVINSGIKTVEFMQGYRDKSGIELLCKAGIEVNWMHYPIFLGSLQGELLSKNIREEVISIDEVEEKINNFFSLPF